MKNRLIRRTLGLALLSASFTNSAAAQMGGPDPGVNREQMWPAPTEEDWAKPCLIQWQRTYEDAVAVSKATGKPILVCVNMDGEIASEHYAGIRYRQPDKAKLYEPYVCVIASTYRHNPRDYDEQGQRILCPRFGSVTCGEHIWIEPKLFDQFFEGQRVAPRHIGVEPEQGEKEMYDVFYAWDTDSVFDTIKEGVKGRDQVPFVAVMHDRPIVNRVESPDNLDKTAVEKAFVMGDGALRRQLVEAAVAAGDKGSVDLLRLAVFGQDMQLAKMARQALAQSNSEQAVDLIAAAMPRFMEPAEREGLVGALERIGAKSSRAKMLANVYRGVGTNSATVDAQGWLMALEKTNTYKPALDWFALESALADVEGGASTRPDSAQARLELAEATLALAVDPNTAQMMSADPRRVPKYMRLLFEDTKEAALQAEQLGATGWRVDAVVALASYYLGDMSQAFERAEKAVAQVPAGAEGWNAMAVLALFVNSRQRAVMRAVRTKQDWPSEWLSDVHAAYSILAEHPLGNDAHAASHYDFLRRLGASGDAGRVLDLGLARFPDSAVLHDRFRARVLAEGGLAQLEATYEAMLLDRDAPQHLEWFAGYASLIAAEMHRRGGDLTESLAAYGRCIRHFESSIEDNLDTRETSDHYIALAHAGRSRIAFERKDYAQALDELIASLERRPEAAGSLDGLNLAPADTARMLRAKLREIGKADDLARLDAVLATVDAELLQLPAYERGIPQGQAIGESR